MKIIGLRALLLKNTGFQIMSQVISLGIGLVTAWVLSRYLGVEGFGQFNYIFAFFYFFLTLNDLGVNTIVVRSSSQEPDRAGEIIGAMLSFKLILSLISVVIAWTAIAWFDFPTNLRNSLFLYTLILPVIALELPSAIFQVVLRLDYPSMIGMMNRVVGFLLLVGVVWMKRGLLGLTAAMVLAEVVYLLVLLKFSMMFVRPIFKVDFGIWKKILRSSITIGIAGIFVAINNRVNFIMLERMTNLRELGMYAAAYRVTSCFEAFPLMLMGTLYPVMCQYAIQDTARLERLYRKSLLLIGLVGIPLGVMISVFSPLIVKTLFGVGFHGAEKSLRILVWSTVFMYLALTGGNLLISIGKEKINLYIQIFAAMVHVGLNFLWIPRWGSVGAASSIASAFFFIAVLTLICAERRLKYKV